MESLSSQFQREVLLFKRQYLQLQNPLVYPASQYLKDGPFQKALYDEIFADGAVDYAPPERYQLGVLKELVNRIETSITDWDEEGISDDLMTCFSHLVVKMMPSEAVSAQQRSYVTYTLPVLSSLSSLEPSITLLESRSLLGTVGTTGFRTWDACLHLGAFLCSTISETTTTPSTATFVPPQIRDRTILELGVGTGFLSVLCAKYLHAKHVVATDGFETVLSDLPTNLYLNGLESSALISLRELKWGHALMGGEDSTFLEGKKPDVIIGADLTYDVAALPSLVATLVDLVEIFPDVEVVFASTVRNETTYARFLEILKMNKFEAQEAHFEAVCPEEQEGPFYDVDVPIKICKIVKLRG